MGTTVTLRTPQGLRGTQLRSIQGMRGLGTELHRVTVGRRVCATLLPNYALITQHWVTLQSRTSLH